VRRFPTPEALVLSTATQDGGPRHFDGVDLARNHGLTGAVVALLHGGSSSSRDPAQRMEQMGLERLALAPLYLGQQRFVHARMRRTQQQRPIHPASPQVRTPWREERRSGDTAPRVPHGGVRPSAGVAGWAVPPAVTQERRVREAGGWPAGPSCQRVRVRGGWAGARVWGFLVGRIARSEPSCHDFPFSFWILFSVFFYP
jgi:hypothetical protein